MNHHQYAQRYPKNAVHNNAHSQIEELQHDQNDHGRIKVQI